MTQVILLFKQLDRGTEAEQYASECGLSAHRLHLQNPLLQTQPWWELKDRRLPKWLKNLRQPATVRIIRADLQRCLKAHPGAFDDSANDWFFVGSRHRWTGLNLMHSARGGWQESWCGKGGCARNTCERLRGRAELNHSLWADLRSSIGSERAPPMYVNFYALAPHAHIIPHLGNDLRLTIHLALEVPPQNQSYIRVGDETFNYTHAGQMLVFDDAYDHEVWNQAATTRLVLGITIWHPELLRRHVMKPSFVPSGVAPWLSFRFTFYIFAYCTTELLGLLIFAPQTQRQPRL